MESATFYFVRWQALITPTMSLVVLVFPAAFLLMGIFAMVLFARGELVPTHILVGAPFMVLLSFWMATMMWQWVRYRHALWSRYEFDSRGVLIESKGSSALVPWQEFSSAEHLILFSIIRLKSPTLAAPVVIFDVSVPGYRGGPPERWKLAKELMISEMGRRFKRRWLP